MKRPLLFTNLVIVAVSIMTLVVSPPASSQTFSEVSANFRELTRRVRPTVVQIFVTGFGPARNPASGDLIVKHTSEVREQEPDNGYSMIVWRQSCTPAEDVIFSSLHKVVLGNDRLYILNKVWKEDPSNRIWRRWENFFEDVYVCDPNRPEHPCRPIPRDPGNATGGGGRSAL